MGEVFVLHPVLNKNLSRIFKIHSRFPGISLGRRSVELCQKMVFIFGRAVLEEERWFSDPPGVVSGIGRGGPSSPYGDTCPLVNHLLGPPFG
jgi:hypothetical protein